MTRSPDAPSPPRRPPPRSLIFAPSLTPAGILTCSRRPSTSTIRSAPRATSSSVTSATAVADGGGAAVRRGSARAEVAGLEGGAAEVGATEVTELEDLLVPAAAGA